MAVLLEFEESARAPLLDDAYNASGDRGSQSRVASPAGLSDGSTDASFSVSVMRVGGRRVSILVWDEKEDEFMMSTRSAIACRGVSTTHHLSLASASPVCRVFSTMYTVYVYPILCCATWAVQCTVQLSEPVLRPH